MGIDPAPDRAGSTAQGCLQSGFHHHTLLSGVGMEATWRGLGFVISICNFMTHKDRLDDKNGSDHRHVPPPSTSEGSATEATVSISAGRGGSDTEQLICEPKATQLINARTGI